MMEFLTSEYMQGALLAVAARFVYDMIVMFLGSNKATKGELLWQNSREKKS